MSGKVCIGRHQGGITLNPLEYICEKDPNVTSYWDSKDLALDYMKEATGKSELTEEDMAEDYGAHFCGEDGRIL